VLAPAVSGDAEATLFAGRRRAWAGAVAAATLLLLVSGFYNFFTFIRAYDNLPKLYHPLFGGKFLLSIGLLAIAAFLAGRTERAASMRASAKFWLNVALLLALGVFVCGAMLRSLRDVPGARTLPAPALADDAPAFETTAEPAEPADSTASESSP
jgi:hypothetical protein